MKKSTRIEYAVEVNYGGKFVRQIDIFDTYDEACDFADKYNGELTWGQYLNIIFIKYDEYGNEIEFGEVI